VDLLGGVDRLATMASCRPPKPEQAGALRMLVSIGGLFRQGADCTCGLQSLQRYEARRFFDSNLDYILRQTGITALVLTGISSNCGVMYHGRSRDSARVQGRRSQRRHLGSDRSRDRCSALAATAQARCESSERAAAGQIRDTQPNRPHRVQNGLMTTSP
jgi:hypothetical protein